MGRVERLETALRTVLGCVVLPVGILIGSTLALVLALLGIPPSRVHLIYLACARLCLWVGGTRLEVQDAHHMDGSRAFVVVPNHESNWDGPCVTAGLSRLTLRFVAKSQLMRIPVFGHAMRLTGNVAVVRTDTERDVRELGTAMSQWVPGVSVVFFAEGTRSSDGALYPFKMGAFATALGKGLPILPVGIAGTYTIWPKGAFRLRRGLVVIKVGRPILTDGLSYEDHAALRDCTFESVSRLRADARARLRANGSDPGGID
jgi:1-acyl-sn-glycerol-3-phosphate acyltransferase